MPSLREPTAQAGEGSEAFSLASDPRLGCGLCLYFEALHGSSPQRALQSYFRPQPKSATANYTANNGEGACSARLETPERGAKTDFSPGQSHEPPRGGPGSPAARPAPETPGAGRGGGGGWELGAEGGCPPGAAGPRVAGSPRVPAPRGGRSLAARAAERGRRGDWASWPRSRDRGRRGTGRRGPGFALRPTPAVDVGSRSREPGPDARLPSPFSEDRRGDARTRGSSGGRAAAAKRGRRVRAEAHPASPLRPAPPAPRCGRHSPGSCSAGAGPGRSRSGPR